MPEYQTRRRLEDEGKKQAEIEDTLDRLADERRRDEIDRDLETRNAMRVHRGRTCGPYTAARTGITFAEETQYE